MRQTFHIILFCVISCTFLQAQSIADLNKRRKKAETEIAYIDKLLKANTQKQKSELAQLNLTRQKLVQRKELIASIDLQIRVVEQELKSKNNHVSELQTHLDGLKESFKNLLYQAYKYRDSRSWLMFILSSDDFGMAYRRWQYFKRLSEHINEVVANIKTTSLKINTEISSLTQKRQELNNFLGEKQNEVNKLQKEEQSVETLIKSLSGKEQQLKKEAEAQRKEINRINTSIERIIAEEAKKQQKRESANLPVDRALTANFENNRNNLPWPVRKGVVIDKFGEHAHPVYKGIKINNHGIDISTESGSKALSIFNGNVIKTFTVPVMNNCVLVQHGNFFSLYCKLGAVQVKVGDKINAGQEIGSILTTNEGGTVLHFELWKGTQKLNPELWLAK
ncbi:MAG: peptidoglycan DD-metalloendopeptidase family protein [Bacteroidales bacterium]|nr:peptidoglycan DD-metalloendopeptidase family protein [Bacteroidales bacterium]MCL2133435.1 peptidoglycan DD-metalloendopeptidase family protein [Bacteroidales bacterium]